MGKRASSPTGQASKKASQAPASNERSELDDSEMGEFEDQWDDEVERDEDAGEVVDALEQGDDDDDEAEMEVEEPQDEPRASEPIPYLPGGPLEEGETLQPDMSTYPLLHSFVPTWPSLSFDVLRDNGGEERRGYPVSCAVVSGTQSMDRTANELTIMRWEGLGKTKEAESEIPASLRRHCAGFLLT